VSGLLGFTRLPIEYFAFVAVATGAYLVSVEAVKRRLLTGEKDKRRGTNTQGSSGGA